MVSDGARGWEPNVQLDTSRAATSTGGRTTTERSRRIPKTSETVAQNIVHDIVDQGLRTGDRLPLEAAMVQNYHVSRASLREALRLLEVQGLISLKPGPGGGPVVGAVDPANLARTTALFFHFGGSSYRELFETEILHEPICAELAARNPDRVSVRAAMTPFLIDGQPIEGREYVRNYEHFRDAVYALGGNGVFTLLARSITQIIAAHVVASMDPVPLRRAIVEEHQELAQTIIRGQATKAGRLMAEHFQKQLDFYKEHWPDRLSELIEWR